MRLPFPFCLDQSDRIDCFDFIAIDFSSPQVQYVYGKRRYFTYSTLAPLVAFRNWALCHDCGDRYQLAACIWICNAINTLIETDWCF